MYNAAKGRWDVKKEVSREKLLLGSIIRPKANQGKNDVLTADLNPKFKNSHFQKLRKMSIRNVSILGIDDPSKGP